MKYKKNKKDIRDEHNIECSPFSGKDPPIKSVLSSSTSNSFRGALVYHKRNCVIKLCDISYEIEHCLDCIPAPCLSGCYGCKQEECVASKEEYLRNISLVNLCRRKKVRKETLE